MSEQQGPIPPGMDREPTEEELRAAYEEQLRRIRVEDVIVQTVLSLVNLGALRAGLVPGQEAERDPQQLQQAIEGIRALLPLVEGVLGPDAAQIRDAVSRLQMAYAQPPGEAPGQPAGDPGDAPAQAPPPAGEPPPPESGDAGPAQRSGRLWVPGQ
jgi:hypothetical protein